MVEVLSLKQRKTLDFIRRYLSKNHYPPTIRDIVDGCGISSTSVVNYNLNILEKKGHIRRRREVSRGIELLGQFGENSLAVPLIGQIAAGQPIPVPEAGTLESPADTIEVGRELIRGREDVFALKVKGTSMIDALINDGDIVLMEPVKTVENGQMAAIWIKEDKEVTLKKFYAEPPRIRLQPANSQMKPIFTTPDNVEIQGRVIAVIRKLG